VEANVLERCARTCLAGFDAAEHVRGGARRGYRRVDDDPAGAHVSGLGEAAGMLEKKILKIEKKTQKKTFHLKSVSWRPCRGN
jgi:hypothetical protein